MNVLHEMGCACGSFHLKDDSVQKPDTDFMSQFPVLDFYPLALKVFVDETFDCCHRVSNIII